MNRKKKIQGILKKRMKKAKAKLSGVKKDSYVSKAERAKLAEQNEANENEIN